MSAPATVFLGLGSNLGPREQILGGAVRGLEWGGLRVARRSSLYLTEPVGGPAQDWFVNAVVQGETERTPESVLSLCLELEARAGRVRAVRHGPRSLDLDLLLFDDAVRSSRELTLPHPRLQERRFVLVPLCEIAPQARHPVLGRTAAELLAQCGDPGRVVRHQPPEAWA